MLWLAAGTLDLAPLRAVADITASAAEVLDAGASLAAANLGAWGEGAGFSAQAATGVTSSAKICRWFTLSSPAM